MRMEKRKYEKLEISVTEWDQETENLFRNEDPDAFTCKLVINGFPEEENDTHDKTKERT